MSTEFVHLRVHSEYSMVDSTVRLAALMDAVVADGMPAVAVTDRMNLFALIKFYSRALKQGVKPIVGADVLVSRGRRDKPLLVTLLVQNRAGYLNLSRLLSRAYVDGRIDGEPCVDWDWLKGASDHLLALSGGLYGEPGRALLAKDVALAEQTARDWMRLFPGRFYLEVSRCGRPGEESLLHATLDLAQRLALPVVAVNDVRFLRQDEFEAHEVRVCIHQGRVLDDSRRPRDYRPQQYLKTRAEMAELFADVPEALENTVRIAERCNLELELGNNYLPNFPTPAGVGIDQFLRDQAEEGLKWRLQRQQQTHGAFAQERLQAYRERLEIELKVIIDMGFPGYFLIVADFIRWAKEHQVPVGPGRGSGAGSLVAYVLAITDLDPLEHELLFERFLNPERVSMPDFDVDFCMEKRDRVIDYVAEKYGRKSVSQIITYGTMAAKAVVRDVGRVLGLSFGFVDRIAKLVPFDLKMTLSKALDESEDLKREYDTNEEVRNLIDTARALEGLVRNAGKHAGGVVIAPTELTDFTPLYLESDNEDARIVTQFDKDDVEQAGLVKFDFLGLRTLTIIDWALANVRETRGESPDIGAIDMDDPASFELIKSARTTAVFQLESQGMKELIKKLQPDCFEDITALVALFRPGPLQSGMVDDFINRKHGRAEVAYPHPDLEPILKPTYGVILYQEQVMQIAQVLAGYTLGGADLLRRAMGKKKPEEMAKQRQIFTDGAVERGVKEETATYIFDLMEKFAGYGFNKSHSAAYALVAYQTLWMKARYPAEFMAAVLSADMDKTDKVVIMIEECRSMGIELKPPHVNHSRWRFSVAGDGAIVYGLGAIKGVGEAAIVQILEARESAGAFLDLFDFCRRLPGQKVNKKVLEALIRCGAMDGLGANRASLMTAIPEALKYADQTRARHQTGQGDLFSLAGEQRTDDLHREILANIEPVEEWDDSERLYGEKETLGLYLSGHPVDAFDQELNALVSRRIGDLEMPAAAGGSRWARPKGQELVIAGLVVAARHNKTQRGRMASVTLDDRTGRIEVTVFSELYEQCRTLLEADRILVVQGHLGFDEYRDRLSLTASSLLDLNDARNQWARRLCLRLGQRRLKQLGIDGVQFAGQLKERLSPHLGGGCELQLDYENASCAGSLLFSGNWRLHPDAELIRGLKRWIGADALQVRYQRPGAVGAGNA